jgi:N-acetylglucosaminyldiphosphoundecaprenol N-acetyl-beta-D-mannosaminyltransferase
MIQNAQINCMGYHVFAGQLKDIVISESRQNINTLNAYSYVIAKRDLEFSTALRQASILIADGFPVVVAARLLRSRKIKKIAGADLFYHLMGLLEEKKGKCFFLGSSVATLELIRDRAAREYPNIETAFLSPPFREDFLAEENRDILKKINDFNPDVLFVGMTAPKQEKWVKDNLRDLQVKTVASIGAVFNFYAGNIKRAPAWMITMKLEWFYRLCKEPKRMWKRYLFFSPVFFWDMFLFLIKIRK